MEERKLATVLFADLVSSTELGEQDPERTRVLLDRFYRAMADEIEAAGGTVEKFAGDAVMAAFGAPAALEDHAERALHAALAMLRRLEEVFGERLALRIGVNTGEVVVAAPVAGSSFVTGDAVNVTARLEQASAPGGILVGERTASAVGGAFEFGEPLTVEAKGKRGGVACRPLVRALTLARPRGVAGLKRTFVGRERELVFVRRALDRAVEEQRAQFVTVIGDAGVGKTRLVRELWELLGAESPAPLRRTGRCLPYGRGITYWPIAEILKEHLGVLEGDPPERTRRRLGRYEILGLAFGLDVATGLHPLEARDRLHEAWVEFLAELASERPTVVLVEDLHWAEEPLLELLGRVADDVNGPLLVLATGRPELLGRRWPWAGGRASTLELEPLGREACRLMLEELLARALPADMRELIVERAEGNPFFVEELVGNLIDHGALSPENGGWLVRELPGGFIVPDSVQAVLSARIDLLPPPEKEALQAASVIGRIFWSGPIYALLAGSEPDLRILEERDFVRRRSGSSMAGEREFAFKHALTREVAYSTLPRARRARLHAAFADWLDRFGEGRDEYASLLAHHYAEAVRPEDADLAWVDEPDEAERLRGEAIVWLRRSAELAIGRYEIDDAIALLERACALEPSEARQGELWRSIGRANALKYDGEAFWEAMQKGIELTSDQPSRADMFSELALETAYRSGMWKRLPAPELVNGWIERALELAAPGSAARARALVARAYRDHTQADAAGEASDIAEQLNDVTLKLRSRTARADIAFAAGDYGEALAWTEQLRGLLDQVTDPDDRALIDAWSIPANAARGRFRDAREAARRQDEIGRRLTPHHRVHAVALRLEVEELTADWEAIRRLSERARQAVEANLDTPCVWNERSLLLCALAAVCRGDEASASELEARALELGMEGYGEILATPRIRLALLRRELEAAEQLLGEPPLPRAHNWWYLSAMTARLDALGAIGDRTRVEAEAPPFLRPQTYLEPFALRALAIVRGDAGSLKQASLGFAALGLDWHAAQTPALLSR